MLTISGADKHWRGYLGINVYWPLELLKAGCWRHSFISQNIDVGERHLEMHKRGTLRACCLDAWPLAFRVATVDKCKADWELKDCPFTMKRAHRGLSHVLASSNSYRWVSPSVTSCQHLRYAAKHQDRRQKGEEEEIIVHGTWQRIESWRKNEENRENERGRWLQKWEDKRCRR